MRDEEGTGEPIYLELADALQLYGAIIGGTPAQAADQLRDQGALEGALARSRSYADYEDADLALQATVLAHGIAGSHRTSFVMRMRLNSPARACHSTSSSDSWAMPTSARPASTCRGIDTEEIISAAHSRRAPMMPASAGLRL